MSEPAILDRVRKLLAKAEDPSCPAPEAEALTAKATELVAKYGIDRALLPTGNGHPGQVKDRLVAMDPPYALDKAALLSGVATALRCRCVQLTRYPDGYKQILIHVFGFESDVERAELLYTSLLVQSAHALAATPAPAWEHQAAFRRSWLAGFTQSVVHRLRQAERRAEEHAGKERGPSVAVVLADRARFVDQRLAETYPRIRTATPRRLSGSGRGEGYDAGLRADLGTTRVWSPGRGRLPR